MFFYANSIVFYPATYQGCRLCDAHRFPSFLAVCRGVLLFSYAEQVDTHRNAELKSAVLTSWLFPLSFQRGRLVERACFGGAVYRTFLSRFFGGGRGFLAVVAHFGRYPFGAYRRRIWRNCGGQFKTGVKNSPFERRKRRQIGVKCLQFRKKCIIIVVQKIKSKGECRYD